MVSQVKSVGLTIVGIAMVLFLCSVMLAEGETTSGNATTTSPANETKSQQATGVGETPGETMTSTSPAGETKPVSIIVKVAPSVGEVPLAASFDVATTAVPVSYAWDLNGDGKVDSTEPKPKYTYTTEGTYTPSVTFTAQDGKTYTNSTTVLVKPLLTATVIANPLSGSAPLAVQFTVAAAGKAPLKYSWDFNSDDSIDSTKQNPGFTYEDVGEYNATFVVTDVTGNTLTQITPITVSNFDSHLKLSSYFPTTLNVGENQITFLVENEGKQTVKDISAKVVGTGITHLSSSSIGSLKAGEQDSIVLRLMIVNSEKVDAKVKVLDKTFPLNFTLNKAIVYNKNELQATLDGLKAKVVAQEELYYEKKAQGFLVSEQFDGIKETKNRLETAQQQLLTGKLADAKVSLELVSSTIEDTNTSLKKSKKEEKSFLQWLGENIGTVAAIITGLAAIGTGAKFAFDHFKRAGEKVKERITTKKEGSKETAKESAMPKEEENKEEPEKKEHQEHHPVKKEESASEKTEKQGKKEHLEAKKHK